MIYSLNIPLLSLLYVILLAFFYFSKKRLKTVENKIFSFMIISNIIGLLLEIGCNFAVKGLGSEIIEMFILKSYLVYLLTWQILMTVYIWSLTRKQEQKYSLKESNILFPVFIALYIVAIFLLYLLKLNTFSRDNMAYTYGLGTNFLYGLFGVLISSWIIMLIKNRKVVTKYKLIPVFAFLMIGFVATFIQFNYPWIILITSCEAFITVLMFHTIENPDINMLEKLNMLKLQAESVNNAKNDWLKQMRHEINTPAGQVQTFNEFNRDIAIDIKNDELLENTKYIDVAIKDIQAMVSNAVVIANLENKELVLEENIYKTEDLIKRITHLVEKNYDKEQVKFTFNIDNHFPKVLIGDIENVERIFVNLLSNAFKYTNEGTVNLNLKTEIDNDICKITIIVADTGTGIKQEDMPLLFNRFERIDFEHNQGDKRGIGLGLSITKLLTELMGGNVSAKSKYGEGSTFTAIINQKMVKGENV